MKSSAIPTLADCGFSALLQTRFSPRFSIFCISVKVHSPLLRQQIRARRIYGHCPSCGYQLHCIVGGGSGCDRSGGAWKRGRQYSSCLCFMKSLPERKKAETSKRNLGSLQNITLSAPLWGVDSVPAAAKAARSAPAHCGAAFPRHTRVSRRPPAQTRRHFNHSNLLV